MADKELWSLGHRPVLDGLRAIAIILVMVSHTGLTPMGAAGPAGVTMFFTLSGFLITALLLDERARTGRIALRAFYVRRALRLLPALVLYLVTMGAFARLSDAPTTPTVMDFLTSLFYVSNYTIAMRGSDNVLLHTWSLSVEEQFYILWPLIVIGILAMSRRHRWLLAIATFGSVLAIVLRLALWNGGAGLARIAYGTDTHMDGLLVGCSAAIWMHGRSPGRYRRGLAVACLGSVVLVSLGHGVVKHLVVPTLVPLLMASAILALVQQPGGGALTGRVMRWIGQRSYGIYLWHFPVFGAAVSLPSHARWPALLLAVIFTFAIAQLSWRCVEEPFLLLKQRRAAVSQRAAERLRPAPDDAPGMKV